ncbi:MAG: hypothetical protein LBI69_04330 [Puniceicoccales bacterium]|jgi:hypothetical protein|nr:hypothetical protein [Puniceicoccales bacterium]
MKILAPKEILSTKKIGEIFENIVSPDVEKGRSRRGYIGQMLPVVNSLGLGGKLSLFPIQLSIGAAKKAQEERLQKMSEEDRKDSKKILERFTTLMENKVYKYLRAMCENFANVRPSFLFENSQLEESEKKLVCYGKILQAYVDVYCTWIINLDHDFPTNVGAFFKFLRVELFYIIPIRKPMTEVEQVIQEIAIDAYNEDVEGIAITARANGGRNAQKGRKAFQRQMQVIIPQSKRGSRKNTPNFNEGDGRENS